MSRFYIDKNTIKENSIRTSNFFKPIKNNYPIRLISHILEPFNSNKKNKFD